MFAFANKLPLFSGGGDRRSRAVFIVGSMGLAAATLLGTNLYETESEEESSKSQALFADTAANLPSFDYADRTNVVLKKQLLSPEEVTFVCDLAARLKPVCGQSSRDARGVHHLAGGTWSTTYLHTGHAFQTHAPDIYKKLRQAAVEADKKEGWNLLPKDKNVPLGARCIEFHEVEPGGALSDPNHRDTGSLITVDIMLSNSENDEHGQGDFTGGELCIPNLKTGEMIPQNFNRGDAVLFVSHRRHMVKPVTSGQRRVLVMEIWQGEERRCAHRCISPHGNCPYGYLVECI